MVVSVDISGTLEERLRRLVELGIYASVSEAVRDALRRLMEQLDLNRIGVNLYREGHYTLNYICEFTGNPCNKVISYFLENGVIPLLGSARTPDRVSIPNEIIISPTSLFVLYTSFFSNLIWKLKQQGIEIYITPSMVDSHMLWEAYSIHKGFLKNILNIKLLNNCYKKRIKINNKTVVSNIEKEVITVAMTCNKPILVSDLRYKQALTELNIPSINIIEVLYESRRRNIISSEEALEILFSLKGVPVLTPITSVEDLTREV